MKSDENNITEQYTHKLHVSEVLVRGNPDETFIVSGLPPTVDGVLKTVAIHRPDVGDSRIWVRGTDGRRSWSGNDESSDDSGLTNSSSVKHEAAEWRRARYDHCNGIS